MHHILQKRTMMDTVSHFLYTMLWCVAYIAAQWTCSQSLKCLCCWMYSLYWYGAYMLIEYTVGDNAAQKVDIIDDYGSEHIWCFGWFYNNTPICVCSCSSHYILSNDSKNLTIVNTSAADVGSYEARVISCEIHGDSSEFCMWQSYEWAVGISCCIK